MPLFPRQHEVGRLDVAVDHAVPVRVLEAQRRLVHVVAGFGHRQGPLGLDDLGQVEPLGVLHRQHEALVESQGGVGGDDVGMMEPGGTADLAEEALEDDGPADQVPPTTLRTSIRPMSVFWAR